MNARVEWTEDSNPLAHNALRLALQEVLGSPLFSRAPRTCKLLTWLVDMKLDSRQAEISEFAIGLAVFRRDARSYDTTLDPVVRVQMGRLRARLAEYAAAQSAPRPRLCIPLGRYVPALIQSDTPTPAVTPVATPLRGERLQLAPLRNLSSAPDSQAFIAGIDEELGSKLFHAFGSLIQLPQQSLAWPASGFDARHRLEGSIRVEQGHVRASMRLVDTRVGDVAWLAQIDRSGELGMQLQEELAGAICGQLQCYLSSV
jgi:TolB-like protein